MLIDSTHLVQYINNILYMVWKEDTYVTWPHKQHCSIRHNMVSDQNTVPSRQTTSSHETQDDNKFFGVSPILLQYRELFITQYILWIRTVLESYINLRINNFSFNNFFVEAKCPSVKLFSGFFPWSPRFFYNHSTRRNRNRNRVYFWSYK